MLYSVIIPCYKSSKTIRSVVEETMQEFIRLGLDDTEFVLVDDCSPDNGATLDELRTLVREYPNITVIELASNTGQHNAQMAGLNFAKGDIIISMDDDGQTNPNQLSYLFDELEKGYDVVYAYYPRKKHSKGRNLGTMFNQWSLHMMTGQPKDLKVSSFWVIRKFVRDYAIQYRSPYTRMSGVFLRVTHNVSCIPVEHYQRRSGSSGYTLKKLIRLWLNIFAFSIAPLRLAAVLGNVTALAGFIGIIVVIIRKLVNPAIAVGWPSILVSILFFSGLILMLMGLVGEYIGRIYLEMIDTPQYVVRQVEEHAPVSGRSDTKADCH